LSPAAIVTYKGFFSEFRFEGGAAKTAASPAGANYFESTPSSTLTNQTFACWVYTPKDSTDLLKANACVRGLELGYHFNKDFLVRFGRRRYEVTEYENMTMANAYTSASHWANVYIPYGWLGGEVRFDRQRENETLRRLMFNVAAMNGAPSGYLALLQGATTVAFAEGKDAPRLTFSAYGILRGNPPPSPANPDIIDNGTANGEGVILQYDHGIFSGGAGFNHQSSSWKNKTAPNGFQTRDEETLYADVHPWRFRIRGAVSWLQRGDQSGKNVFDPAAAQSEVHTEWTFSYQFVEGVQVSLGYVGAFGDKLSQPTHIGFLGFLTTYKGLVPFGDSK
jgi:hypothetical protein